MATDYNPKDRLPAKEPETAVMTPALGQSLPGLSQERQEASFTVGGGIPFTKTVPGQCKWPVQLDARGVMTHCCGKPVTEPGKSFCMEHKLASLTPAARVRYEASLQERKCMRAA